MTSRKLWGGRFHAEQDKVAESFSNSFLFDQKLWKEDLAVLEAHVSMLVQTKVLKKEIGRRLLDAIAGTKNEIENGKLSLSGDYEDIHSFIEAELEKRVGEHSSLIRLARSRNDTVVTDLRLYLKNEITGITALHQQYLCSLLCLAEKFKDSVIPGYTHARRAQPILFSFYCLAHFSAGMRERDALHLALEWTDISTLGAGAVSGTSWPIDSEATAKKLGFHAPFFNALDAVSDRDFLLLFHFASSLISTHLSRLCEDLISWSSEGLAYVELPDGLCTGSSLMPQKKNPDPLELVRGKSGRLFGHLSSLFMLLKGLPMGYNRDLQEDKEPVFDAVKTLTGSLEMITRILDGLSLSGEALCKLWKDDFALATDLADELVKKGCSFAGAHDLVGKTIGYCDEKKKSLRDLTASELKSLLPKFDPKVFAKLSVIESAKGRNSPGGTGEKAVAKALSQAKAWLKSDGSRKARRVLEGFLIDGLESGDATEMTAKDWSALRHKKAKLKS